MAVGGYNKQEPPVGKVLISIVASGIFVVITIFFSIAIYWSELSVMENKRELVDTDPDRLKLEAYEAESLATLRWKDKSKGIAEVPIETAIEMTAKKYRR